MYSKIRQHIPTLDMDGDSVNITRNFTVEYSGTRVGPGTCSDDFTSDTGIIYGTYYGFQPSGGALESNTLARCLKRSVKEISGDGLCYMITVEYGPWPHASETSKSPMDQPLDKSGGVELEEKIVSYDIYGNPILNAASEEYVDGIIEYTALSYRKYKKNVSSAEFDSSGLDAYIMTVNDDWFDNHAPGTVLCKDIQYQSVIHESLGEYWTVNYTFLVDDKGHDQTILEKGFNYMSDDSTSATLVRYMVEDPDDSTTKMASPSPCLLAANGSKLLITDPAVYTTWQTKERLNFSALGLGS